MSSEKILWYFADPLCSWCWGFSPVIHSIRDDYSKQLKIALMLGGLRPGTTEVLSPAQREEILHHWHEVHRRTGQPFAFEGALPSDFIYDTEPPSRAVIAVGELRPDGIFSYFTSIQEAFYARGQDVTQLEILATLAEAQQLDREAFLARFLSDDLRNKTRQHFAITRESGVRGFPTVVLQRDKTVRLLTHGYRPYPELKPEIDRWLAEAG